MIVRWYTPVRQLTDELTVYCLEIRIFHHQINQERSEAGKCAKYINEDLDVDRERFELERLQERPVGDEVKERLTRALENFYGWENEGNASEVREAREREKVGVTDRMVVSRFYEVVVDVVERVRDPNVFHTRGRRAGSESGREG